MLYVHVRRGNVPPLPAELSSFPISDTSVYVDAGGNIKASSLQLEQQGVWVHERHGDEGVVGLVATARQCLGREGRGTA